MAEVMLNEGATRLAKFINGQLGTGFNVYVRLFVNNIIPVNTNVLADFTDCSLVGYTDTALSSFVWSGGAAAGEDDRSGAPIYMTLAPYAGGVTIYGYVLAELATGVALWADTFPAPFNVPAGGAVISLVPSEKVKIA